MVTSAIINFVVRGDSIRNNDGSNCRTPCANIHPIEQDAENLVWGVLRRFRVFLTSGFGVLRLTTSSVPSTMVERKTASGPP